MPFPFSPPFLFLFLLLVFFTWDSFVIFVQAVQEVFVVEEWVKDAWKEARVEAILCVEADKSL